MEKAVMTNWKYKQLRRSLWKRYKVGLIGRGEYFRQLKELEVR